MKNCINKRLQMLTMILLLSSSSIVTAQNHDQGYIYLDVHNQSEMPIAEGSIYTNNQVLNNLFDQFDVVQYSLSWPQAKSEQLKHMYEIHLNGNVGDFKSALKETELFNDDRVFVAEYYRAGACANPQTIDDPWITQNWANDYHLDLLDAWCAWTITHGEPNIVVGVVDTEFDITHEDLVDRFVSVTGTNTTCVHGTYVSSCVATTVNNGKGIAGIGYDTRIAGYVVPGNCSGNPWPMIWQAHLDGRKIINVSWTGVGSPATTAAIQEIIDGGATLVVSAGNSPSGSSHSAYANIPGVINVSGVNYQNLHGPTGHVSNQWVDVCALSRNVTMTSPGNGYFSGNGTSFAAPQVAGVAALLLSVNPCLEPSDIEDIIKSSTDAIADAANYPNGLGTGRVNAYQALQLAQNYGQSSIISSSVSWLGDHYVKNPLIIDNGATLTITGTVRMAQDARIEVKPGSKLVVDGGLITKAGCDARWKGIFVHGNSTASQSVSPHLFGEVELKNGATIEYADDALNNFGLTSGGNTDWNTFGGVIQCDDALFINNKRSAQFLAYTNKNSSGNPINDQSYFRKCDFTYTDDAIGGNLLYAHISQWATRGVTVHGCTFSNSQSAPMADRGRGILTIDADLTVADHCNSGTYPCPPASQVHNTFDGFNYGMHVTGFGSGDAETNVSNATFTDNTYGVYSGSSEYIRVNGSTFNLALSGSMGVYLEESPSTDVYSNMFYGFDPANLNAGTVAQNLGGTPNSIRDNEFHDLFVGCSNQGGNKNGILGLEYRCNKYYDNWTSIWVTNSNPQMGAQGIAAYQGASGDGAGNEFYNSSYIDFFNNSPTTETIVYWHHTATAPSPLIPTTIGSFFVVDAGVTLAQDPCIPAGGTSKSTLLADYNQGATTVNEKQVELAAIEDGGDTEGALQEVNLAGVGQEYELRNHLLQLSPNVSEEVLKRTIEKPAPLPNAMLRDVLAANPQAGKDGEIMEALEFLPLPMDEYMVYQIEQGAKSISPKERKESELSAASMNKERLAQQVVREIMNDTLNYDPRAAEEFLIAKNDLAADLQLMSVYASLKDVEGMETAQQRIDSRELSEREAQRLEGLAEYRSFQRQLMAEGKSLVHGDSATVEKLWQISAGTGPAAEYAQNILEFQGLAEFEKPLLIPSFEGKSNKKPRNIEEQKDGYFQLNPNPAQEYVIVNYDLSHLGGNALLQVMDAVGKLMLEEHIQSGKDQVVFDISALDAGNYTYRVMHGNTMQYSGKLLVN